MYSKPKNNNGLKSKNAIKNAFIELLKVKDISKISVVEIVNKANVNRSTFYAHYSDIYGIVEEIQNDMIEKIDYLINQIEEDDFFINPLKAFNTMIEYLLENNEFFTICVNHQDIYPFCDRMINIFTKKLLSSPSIMKIPEEDEIKKARITYVAGGIVFSYIKWLKKEIHCSLQELTSVFANQIKKIETIKNN